MMFDCKKLKYFYVHKNVGEILKSALGYNTSHIVPHVFYESTEVDWEAIVKK